jgi:hypothetical protein
VRDAGGTGALPAEPDARVRISRQRDRPDRLSGHKTLLYSILPRPGVLRAGAGAFVRNCNITALVSGSREHSFMSPWQGGQPSNEANRFSARGSSGSYPGAWCNVAGAKGCRGERRPFCAMGLAD